MVGAYLEALGSIFLCDSHGDMSGMQKGVCFCHSGQTQDMLGLANLLEYCF